MLTVCLLALATLVKPCLKHRRCICMDTLLALLPADMSEWLLTCSPVVSWRAESAMQLNTMYLYTCCRDMAKVVACLPCGVQLASGAKGNAQRCSISLH